MHCSWTFLKKYTTAKHRSAIGTNGLRAIDDKILSYSVTFNIYHAIFAFVIAVPHIQLSVKNILLAASEREVFALGLIPKRRHANWG